jgi:glucose-1-phosphate cytidylyltransferase
VSDVDISELVKFHKQHGKAITMTSVQPEGRFGSLQINNNEQVISFVEKPKGDGAWINGGFFVCESKVFDYIRDDDMIVFEKEPLETLAKNGELYTYKHYGFWKPMDTLRDKSQLEDLIENNKAPWIKW